MAREILLDRLLMEKPLFPGLRDGRSRRSPVRPAHARSRSTGRDTDETLGYKKLLEVDLGPIKRDAQTDINMRKKLGTEALPMEQWEVGALVRGVLEVKEKVAAVFTQVELSDKLRMLLNEVLRCQHLLAVAPAQRPSKWQLTVFPSEIFSASSCLEPVARILAILATGLENVIPFVELCHTVLHLPHGLWILDRILLHNPKRILTVYEHLMAQCNGEDLDDPASGFYGEILLHLTRQFPKTASHLHYMAVGQQRFFVLILSLVLEKGRQARPPPRTGVIQHTDYALAPKFILADAVALLFYQLLVAPRGETRQWAVKCVGLAGARQNAHFVECRLQLLTHAHKLLPEKPGLFLPDASLQSASRLIYLYATLKEAANLTLTNDEYRILSKLVTSRVKLTGSGNAFIILGVCCLVSFPELLSERTVEQEIVAWMKWILELDFSGLTGGGTCLEALLLIVAHLRANEWKEVSAVISGYLLTKVNIKPQMVVRLKLLINAEVFRDEALWRYSLRIPPTEKLNAALTHALPVHCIYNILHNKSYAVYNISVKEWIAHQMSKCWLPVHPMMVHLLTVFVQTTLPVLRRISDGPDDYTALQKPFTPADVLGLIYDRPPAALSALDMKKLRTVDLFQRQDVSDPYRNVGKVLMAFYVLLFNDFYMNNLKTFMTAKVLDCRMYGTEVLERIPFKHYLTLTYQFQDLFDPLGDALGRLMLQHLPHMRTVYDEIKAEASHGDRHLALALPRPPADGDDLTRFLDVLTRCPPERIGACLDSFLRLLPRVLTEELPESAQDAFERVWEQLMDVDTNTVLLATTLALLQHKDKSISSITFEELCLEPLHILRCDPIVFRKVFLTRILLRTFSSFLTLSRSYLNQQLDVIDQQQMLVTEGAVDPLREERKRCMFMLQESAAVQILIEQLDAGHQEVSDDLDLPERLTAPQNAVCIFIHQLIISNPTLAKLVVFQTFPPARIPLVVRGVESLHICLDYLHEAMALPSVTKKLFILELTSCLCVKFRIARSVAVARLAVDVLATLLTAYPREVRREVVRTGARVLARLGNIFPPLREACVGLLEQMGEAERAAETAGGAWRGAARRLVGGGAGRSEKGNGVKAALKCARGVPPLRS
ncbi:integrator complex subunit 2-like [Paramacrobiotus metropolitanus]|uniref:integrator complex subunit 2-like n=1 Tax=Paramacrobiotus metropolitanus TaxID=2943436 RepID=UPI0024462A82|nr:integrator complex subunit 2-like [Paramacrobiotus metropolitanus]